MEKELVSTEVFSKMHDSSLLKYQIRFLFGLLDISRKYNFLGYKSRAIRTYLRAKQIYKSLDI